MPTAAGDVAEAATRPLPVLPLRVVADVHAQPDALREALDGAGDRHVVLLGDLIDRGPDAPAVLRLVLDLVEAGQATLLRSNHDDRLHRHYLHGRVPVAGELARTIADLDAQPDARSLIDRFQAVYAAAPLWLRVGERWIVAHGAVDRLMLDHPSPAPDLRKRTRDRLKALALYGEREGNLWHDDGRPVRTHGWVDALPAGLTAIVGHDVRSAEAPLVVAGARGGRAIFLDTGSGKDGRLSWIDLPEERITVGDTGRQRGA